jgi:hypothetical protein
MIIRDVGKDGLRPGPAGRGPGRFLRLLDPWWAFGPFAGAAAGTLTAVRLFLPGPVGLADNGDGPQRMCALNLVARVDPDSVPWFGFVNFGYVQAPPGACDPALTYPGSGQWLLRIAHPLSHLLGLPGEFDLRALAVLFCAVVALAFTVFGAALRGRLPARLLVCALLFLVAGDSAFAGYAASPFSELAGLAGILLATAGASHFGGRPWARLAGLLVFTGGAVLAVASKTQAATMAVPFAALLLTVGIPLGRARGGLARRVLPLLAAAVIGCTGVLTLSGRAGELREINPTEVVFVGVLGHSDDPAADAVALGLPADFAQYAGRSWWVPEPPQNDPRWPEVRDRMTYGNIAGFLLRHPVVATRIPLAALGDFAAARPGYLGSYPVAAGHPSMAQESRLALYSSLLRYVGSALLFVVLGLGVVGVRRWRTGAGNPRRQALAGMTVCLAGVSLVQFLTAAYGESIENTKHLVYAILATGLAPVLAVAAAVCSSPAGPASGEVGAVPVAAD